MESFWDHFSIILGSFYDHFGIILGSFWDHFRIILGQFWDDFWIILGSFWDEFGMTFQIPIYFKRTYFMNHTNCFKLADFFLIFLICPIFIKDFSFFKPKIQSISCTIYFNSGPTFKKKWVTNQNNWPRTSGWGHIKVRTAAGEPRTVGGRRICDGWFQTRMT